MVPGLAWCLRQDAQSRRYGARCIPYMPISVVRGTDSRTKPAGMSRFCLIRRCIDPRAGPRPRTPECSRPKCPIPGPLNSNEGGLYSRPGVLTPGRWGAKTTDEELSRPHGELTPPRPTPPRPTPPRPTPPRPTPPRPTPPRPTPPRPTPPRPTPPRPPRSTCVSFNTPPPEPTRPSRPRPGRPRPARRRPGPPDAAPPDPTPPRLTPAPPCARRPRPRPGGRRPGRPPPTPFRPPTPPTTTPTPRFHPEGTAPPGPGPPLKEASPSLTCRLSAPSWSAR
jgi:hypothetical protein